MASAVSTGFVAPIVFSLGRSAAKDAAKDIAKDQFVKRASQIAGAYAVNAPQRIGETYGFTGDAEASFLSGGVQGAVDLFADITVLRALGKAAKGPAKEKATSALREITAGAARQAGIEGATESIQSELQLLAKVYADPDFDYTGDQANLMRLEAAVTGTVLGGGTGGAVNTIGQAARGGQSALTQFAEGARVAETDFIPETDAQIQTQLLELRQGRGREAVVKTDGPLSPQDLQDQGLQQVELADGQGTLIVRDDQDINEIKEAFESGSRDVLGNGTVNKPEGGTEVVRSVNADGSRGADVVVTPDTEQAVTTAQEAKSDVGQVERITAEQAVNERLNTVDDQIDIPEDIRNQLQLDGDEAQQLSETAPVETVYGTSMREVDYVAIENEEPGYKKPAGYRSNEAASNAIDRLVGKRATQTGRAESEIYGDFAIREEDGQFYIVETATNPAARVAQIAGRAAGTTELKNGTKVLQSQRVKKALDKGQKPAKSDLEQVISMIDPEGKRLILDLGTLAREGIEQMRREGTMPQRTLTFEELNQAGVQQALTDLAMAGYEFDPNAEADGLAFDQTKVVRRGQTKTRAATTTTETNADQPNKKDYTIQDETGEIVFDEAAFLRAMDDYNRRKDYGVASQVDRERGRDIEEGFDDRSETERMAENAVDDDQPLPRDQEYAEAARTKPKRLNSFQDIGTAYSSIGSNMKAILGASKISDIIRNSATFLRQAIKLTGRNIVLIDSDGLRRLLDGELDPDVRARLERRLLNPSIGVSMYPAGKDFGIVYINTDEVTRLTEGLNKATTDATVAWIVLHELGHQYHKDVIDNLNQEDLAKLNEVFNESELADWYNENTPATEVDPTRPAKEWFADRVAAYGMAKMGGGRAESLIKGDSAAAKFTNDLIKKIVATLDNMYKVWRDQFAKGAGILPSAQYKSEKGYAESKAFNEWMDYVLGPDMDQEPPSAPPPPDAPEGARPAADGSALPDRVRESYEYFRTFGREGERPRFRNTWRQAFRDFRENGVTSLLGRVFFSSHQQLRSLGTPGRRIARMMYKLSSTQGRDGFLQRALYKHQELTGKLYDFLPKDAERITQILDQYAAWREAGADIQNVPEDIRPYFRNLNKFFDSIQEYLADSDPNFVGRENYFPHIYDPEALADPRKREALVQLLIDKEGMAEAEARRSVESLRAGLTAYESAPDNTAPSNTSLENRQWTNLTFADLKEAGVLHNSRTMVFKYVRETTRAAEFHRVFGGQYNGQYRADAAIRRELDRMSDADRAKAEVLIDGMLGRLGSKLDPNSPLAELQSYVQTLQFSLTLTFATLASLPDIMMPALRSREFSGVVQNMRTVVQMLSDSESRQAMYEEARVLGTVTNDVVNDAIIAGYGSEWMTPGSRRVSDFFFKAIGLEHWTRFSRVVATSMARQFIVKHATERTPRGIRYLDELGVDGETVRQWIDSGYDYNTPDGQAVQKAILRFTEESILRPNSAERPTYMSDPRFMLIAQLKGFYYSFGQKVVGGIIREMQTRAGDGEPFPAAMTPMLVAGVALLPLAALALEIREEIKYEESREPTNRLDSAEYLFEMISRAGFLGPLEIPLSMFNAGQYGQPFWVAPLGPAVGSAYDLMKNPGMRELEELIPIYNQFN